MKSFKYLLIMLVSLTISISCNNDDDDCMKEYLEAEEKYERLVELASNEGQRSRVIQERDAALSNILERCN